MLSSAAALHKTRMQVSASYKWVSSMGATHKKNWSRSLDNRSRLTRIGRNVLDNIQHPAPTGHCGQDTIVLISDTGDTAEQLPDPAEAAGKLYRELRRGKPCGCGTYLSFFGLGVKNR